MSFSCLWWHKSNQYNENWRWALKEHIESIFVDELSFLHSGFKLKHVQDNGLGPQRQCCSAGW